MDHFLYRFSTFSEKILSIKNLDFLQNAPSNSVIFNSPFISAAVSCAFSVVKMAATFGIIYATDPLLQNMNKIKKKKNVKCMFVVVMLLATPS